MWGSIGFIAKMTVKISASFVPAKMPRNTSVPAIPVRRTTRTGAEVLSASQPHRCGAMMRVTCGSAMTTPMSNALKLRLSR